MSAWSIPGYDAWKLDHPDNYDDDAAIESIVERISQEADEVDSALGFREQQFSLIVRAYMTGSDVEWARVRADCEAIIADGLRDRAIDILNAQEEEAAIAAAESRADRWSDAA